MNTLVTKKQIPYDSTYVRYLESYRQKVEWWSSGVAGGGGGGVGGREMASCLMGTELQFCKNKGVLEVCFTPM